MSKELFYFLLAIVVLGWMLWPNTVEPLVKTQMAVMTGESGKTWTLGPYTVTSLQPYDLKARLIGKLRYHDGGADLAPLDFAMGWGPMADPGVYERLNITQGGRFYYYSWGPEGPPIPKRSIINNSANMHLVPADAAVLADLESVQPGERIELRGQLIEARRANGWKWRSSLTRTDSGAGACELMWVESVTKL